MSYLRLVGKRAGVLVFAAVAGCMLVPIASCLDATEIVIDVTSNADCRIIGPQGAMIQVGPHGGAPTTSVTTNQCTLADGATLAEMGNIVVLPSGDIDSTVAIEVVASIDSTFKTADCLPEDPKKPCIYARRQISFLPHTRLDLPIELDALCAGVVCDDGFTCQNGACVPDTIDPHDCDGSCTPQLDGGTVPDVVFTKDVITVDVFKDAPLIADVAIDAPCLGTTCNNQCVDTLTDKANCGGCGVDCTNGVCTNGTCRLDTSSADASVIALKGTCLGVFKNAVWISTSSGMMTVPTNGGSPSAVSTVSAFTLATYPNELAWIESNSETTIRDEVTQTSYGQGFIGIPGFMAMSPKGYVWSDDSKNNVWVQPQPGGSPTSYFQFQQGQSIPVAMAANIVYWTVPTGFLYWSAGGGAFAVSATLPTTIIVDDPTSTQPNVFVVLSGDQIEKYDYTLSPLSIVATSTLKTLGALAYDGATVYANGVTQIQKAQNNMMVTVAKTVAADSRCLAVDGTAVYWLEQAGGVFKHAK